jgi:1,2-dihydroxy-3-keto-5-methylthiopentene dioxygenase
MAIVRYPDTGIVIESRDQIADMLGLIGVRFETWGVQRLPPHLRNRNLTEAEKLEVLAIFKPEVERLKEQGRFRFVDVVTFYPETPGIDELLKKFDRRHTHSENEIRYCVQGSGTFHLLPTDGQHTEVEMHAGDFISLPAGIPHYFTMTAERRITCIRFFQREDGWVPDYC